MVMVMAHPSGIVAFTAVSVTKKKKYLT